MDIKKLYEERYVIEGMDRFEDYERNRLLARVLVHLFKPGMRLLDMGCRDGVVAEYFQNLGCLVSGLDISERALEMARARGIKDLYQGDLEKPPLPYSDKEFDIVFWGDNIEHLFDPQVVLREVRRILKDKGTLILSVPNMGNLFYRFYYAYHGMFIRTEAPATDPWHWSHIRFFNKKVMREFLLSEGFVLTGFWGCSSRKVFDICARIWPSLFGSIMVISAQKML